MKTTFRILLACAIVFLTYICVDSVVTPIEFEETRVQREEAVVKNLIHIRTAEVEFKNQNGRKRCSRKVRLPTNNSRQA